MAVVNIAVVGCGRVATRFHLPAVARSARARLVAVVDADPDWGRQVARQFGAARWLPDHRELPGTADAALVATPNATHAEISAFLLERGVHVLCEKPMARTVAEGRQMIAAASRGGGRLTVAHNCRFTPSMQALARLASGGVLGRITEMTGGMGAPIRNWQARTDFRKEPKAAGGGVLIDLGVHLFDLALWLVGERPESVTYRAADGLGWGVESDADVTLDFPGGGRALLTCSTTRALDRVIRLRGTAGWAVAEVEGSEIQFSSDVIRVCRRDGAQRMLLDGPLSFDAQVDDFCDAILRDRPFRVTPEDALAALELVERCYAMESAA